MFGMRWSAVMQAWMRSFESLTVMMPDLYGMCFSARSAASLISHFCFGSLYAMQMAAPGMMSSGLIFCWRSSFERVMVCSATMETGTRLWQLKVVCSAAMAMYAGIWATPCLWLIPADPGGGGVLMAALKPLACFGMAPDVFGLISDCSL